MTHHPSRMKMTSSSPFGGDSNGPSNGTPVQIELDINRIRLPQNWAIGNQNGSIYFVDHLNKITTYEDPRKAIRDKLINDHVRLSELNDVSNNMIPLVSLSLRIDAMTSDLRSQPGHVINCT